MLVRDRRIGTAFILSSPQAVSGDGFANRQKSESAQKPRKSWRLGKRPQTVPPPGAWTRPGSGRSFWRPSSGSQGSGLTLQPSQNGLSVGFVLSNRPLHPAQQSPLSKLSP